MTRYWENKLIILAMEGSIWIILMAVKFKFTLDNYNLSFIQVKYILIL
jgi:hypothetical protein